jgi:hypothetical protein
MIFIIPTDFKHCVRCTGFKLRYIAEEMPKHRGLMGVVNANADLESVLQIQIAFQHHTNMATNPLTAMALWLVSNGR